MRVWLPILPVLLMADISLMGQVPAGAVARYTFNDQRISDEVSGDTARLIGTKWTTDRFGNKDHAVKLAGHNMSYISLGTSSRLRPPVGSISMWVKLDEVVTAGTGYKVNPLLLAKNTLKDDFYEAYGLYFNLQNHAFDGSSSRDSVTQVGITMLDSVLVGSWYHLVLSYSDNELALYVNGNLINRSNKQYPTLFEPTDSVLLGHTNNRKNLRFTNGVFDDLFFYDRVLTHDEVLALYEAPNPNRLVTAIQNVFRACVILLAIGLLVLLIRWRLNISHRRERQKLELQNLLLETELRVNRALLNPHFVFNSLNTLQNLILTNNSDAANNYLVKFSRLIRRLLETNLTNSITLEAEVELLRRYLEIEQMRFEGDIRYDIAISPGLDPKNTHIPVMMIQPFVENAIWHGLRNKEGKKIVTITFEPAGEKRIRCTVDDNGIGRELRKTPASDPQSLATKFIVHRLKLLNLLYKTNYQLSIIDKPEGGTRVEMELMVGDLSRK